MTHDLWTFHLVGGKAAAIQSPGNPVLSHNGRMTIDHLMVTQEQADSVVAFFEGQGCTVTARKAPRETLEQHKERMALLGAGKQDKTWPTVACPGCYWFDPRDENPCGFEVWTREVVSQSLRAHPVAGQCLHDCPIHGDIEDSSGE